MFFIKLKFHFWFTMFFVAFVTLLASCNQSSNGNDFSAELESEIPLFTKEDIANARQNIAQTINELSGVEGSERPVGKRIDLGFDDEKNDLSTLARLTNVTGSVCYLRQVGKSNSILVQDNVTGKTTLVYSTDNPIESLACSHDGVFYAFTEHDGNDNEVYFLQIGFGAFKLTDNNINETQVSLSYNAFWIAWEGEHKGKRAIFWGDNTTGVLNVLFGPQNLTYPKLTNLGTIISFVKRLNNGKNYIFNYHIETNSFDRIYINRNKLTYPSSSDDGTIVGWKQTNSKGRNRVRIMDAKGNITNAFSSTNDIDRPLLTCDGVNLSYARRQGNSWDSYTRNWATGQEALTRSKLGKDYYRGFWAMHCSESSFKIVVKFIDDNMTPNQKAIFETAADRWAQIITEGLEDAFVNVPPGGCIAGDPGVLGIIDDIVILAGAPDIDGPGGIAGQAGPCVIRLGGFTNGLPAYGVMSFDKADIDQLEALGLLNGVIQHEMGHVLGLGSTRLWFHDIVDFQGLDTRHIGTNSVNQWRDLGGSGNVPVAITGGRGTRNSHWREDTFGNELMTGFINSATSLPLSRQTIGGLDDLGYVVNYAAADPYELPSLQSQSSAHLDEPILIHSDPLEKIFYIDMEPTLIK